MKSVFIIITVLIVMSGCSGKTSGQVKLTTWNVQTFFDSVTEGTEYSEFTKAGKWNSDAYSERLKRLCSSMKKMNSDVFVLEEIENEAVMYDIGELLAGEWNNSRRYRYACFAKKVGGATGCGVISRLPLEQLSVHGLDVRDSPLLMPLLRPILQVRVRCGEKNIVLLINHWKSQSGKDDGSFWRKMQEKSLCIRLALLSGCEESVIACGDFNQDCVELEFMDDSVDVREEELESDSLGSGCGSYFFREQWSTLDHILYSGVIKITKYWAETDGDWCDALTGIPYKYKVWNGTGYSDHLPVSCLVSFL